MAYFPLFQDLQGRRIYIFGGGRVALRKAEKLLPFGPELTVVAPEILPELAALPVARVCREYREADLDAPLYCVIAATDRRDVNRAICQGCRERNIPVNTVDDPKLCTFLFPSLVKNGPLTVGITTSGASPTAAIWVREQLEALLPEDMEGILLWLMEQREAIQKAIPEERARVRCQRRLFAACMEQGGPLPHALQARIIQESTEES